MVGWGATDAVPNRFAFRTCSDFFVPGLTFAAPFGSHEVR